VERVAQVGDGELVGGEREQATGAATRPWRVGPACRVDRSGAVLAPADGDDIVRHGRIRAAQRRRPIVQADPLAGVVRLGSDERPRAARAGWRPRARPRHCSTGSLRGLHPDLVHLGVGLQTQRDLRCGLLERWRHRHAAAHRHERHALAHATVGLLGPLALQRRQPADHDRDDEEQQQAEPLGRVRDLEREPGRGEQEVVCEEGDARGGDGRPRAKRTRGDDHRDQVDRRRVLDADPVLQPERRRGGEHEREGDEGDPRCDVKRPCVFRGTHAPRPCHCPDPRAAPTRPA